MTSSRLQVLVIDDDPAIRKLFADLVAPQADCEILTASSGEEGLDVIASHEVDVVFVDLKLGGMDGITFVETVRRNPDSPEVALITGFGDMDIAVRAMKNGAFDCIPKPFKPSRIVTILEQFRRFARLKNENRFLRSQLREEYSPALYLGASTEIRRVRDLASQAAQTTDSVLIYGAEGSGRRHLAQVIHYSGSRSKGPFVLFDPKQYREDAWEDVLFGHRPDAMVRQADGGTLLIHEVSEFGSKLQARLLEALRSGSQDIRWMVTTSNDLREAVNRELFDSELLREVGVAEISVPDLKDRGEDVELIAYRFLDRVNERREHALEGYAPAVLEKFHTYSWPGNVRELESAIESAGEQAKGSRIQLADLPGEVIEGAGRETTTRTGTETRNLQEMEKEAIRATLDETQGDTAMAARILGIDRSTLYRKLKRYEMGLPRTGRISP